MASVVPTPTRPAWLEKRWPRFEIKPLVAALDNETILVIGLVLIGLVAHALNMFNYPSFTIKDDEGIYAEQAWAVLREGHITHYTYTYDHAPGGWIQLAGWMALTGGVHSFGSALDGGRVLMLVLHLAMIPLLYRLTRKLGGSPTVAALATFIFSVSPLALFYQRMVLLDNFMLFWLLASANLLLDGRGRLSRVFASGICFGLAFLSKETAIILLPVFLLLVWQQRWKHQGRFAIGLWIVPVVMVVSWYLVYAIFKGELLPNPQIATTFDNTGNPVTGVSLFDALKWQATRQDDGNKLWTEIIPQDWLRRDAFLLVGGAIASVLNLLRGFRNRRAFVVGALGLLPLYYLGRGGVVFSYYIAFAVPFLALNIAYLAGMLLARLPKPAAGTLAMVAGSGLLASYLISGSLQPLFTERPDVAGREAVAWVKQNLPSDSKIIMRDDMWADLHEPGYGGPGFPDAHPHWKVAYDPAIYNGVFGNDWRNVDYLIMSPGLNYAFEITNNKLALDALSHAQLVKRFVSDKGNAQLHEPQLVEIWKVNKAEIENNQSDLLAGSAGYLTSSFEQNGEYVGADGNTNASSQASALLRAVWLNDRPTFERVWNWTQTHLVNEKGLLSWQWRNNSVSDRHTSADADSDTALALLMAGQRWNNAAYLEAGRRMAQAIWQHEVTQVNGQPYITAGDWAAQASIIPINSGYFAPYAYRIFQAVDPNHDWLGLVSSGYQLLFQSSAATFSSAKSTGLPPDWVGLNRASGELVPLQLPGADMNTTQFGNDAAKVYWRVALDLSWWNDGRAKTFLSQATFLQDEMARKGYISAAYSHDGAILKDSPSLPTTTGTLAALLTLDPAMADQIYQAQIKAGVRRTGAGYFWNWGYLSDLETNEWGWFATALYNKALPNLWQTGGK